MPAWQDASQRQYKAAWRPHVSVSQFSSLLHIHGQCEPVNVKLFLWIFNTQKVTSWPHSFITNMSTYVYQLINRFCNNSHQPIQIFIIIMDWTSSLLSSIELGMPEIY